MSLKRFKRWFTRNIKLQRESFRLKWLISRVTMSKREFESLNFIKSY